MSSLAHTYEDAIHTHNARARELHISNRFDFTLYTLRFLLLIYYLLLSYNYINTISIDRLNCNRHICQRKISEKPNDFPLGTNKSTLEWSISAEKGHKKGACGDSCAACGD